MCLRKKRTPFDAAIDHRSADFPAQLAAACPKGELTGPIFWTKWSERLHMAFCIKKVEFCWDWKVSGAGGR
jgi:hypothetical protein